MGASPIRLPPTPVIKGASIIIHRHGNLWATAPTNKLKKEGNLCISDNTLAEASDNAYFSINSGSSGAKKEE